MTIFEHEFMVSMGLEVASSPEYVESAHRLAIAACQWMREHPNAGLLFQWPTAMVDPEVMPIGPLCRLREWALDDETRGFAEWLDKTTGEVCSLMQFKLVVIPRMKGTRLDGAGKA